MVFGKAIQHHEEHAPNPQRTAHANRPPLCLHEATRQRQPQAGSLVSLGEPGVQLLKVDEQPGQIGGRDADASVFDLQAEVVRAFGHGAQDDAATLRRELDGV